MERTLAIKDQVSEIMERLPEGDTIKVPAVVRASGVSNEALRKGFAAGLVDKQSHGRGAAGYMPRDEALAVVAAVVIAAMAGIAFIEALKAVKVLPPDIFK
jgi:hypothetical protein